MFGRAFLSGLITLAGAALLSSCAADEQARPVVLAASSMQEGLNAAADGWAAQGYPRPLLSFSSSAAVARQASEGAPADMVVSADSEWMDWLAERGLIRAGTRRDIAANTLVLVTKADPAIRRLPYGSIEEALSAPQTSLAIAEPDTVPAGRYAKAALQSLGIWDDVRPRLVPTENVRVALALVERGETEFGIVYGSDAAASEKAWVVARFDEALYPAIRYPAAVLAGSQHPDSLAFADYLSSREGQVILRRHGFTSPG